VGERGPTLRAALTAVVLAGAWALTATSSAAANLALAPNGSDSNPCTPAAPCRTFDRAYRLALPGQIVDVAAGTYGAQVISLDPSKMSELDVLLRRRPGETAPVVVRGSFDVYGRHVELQGIRFPWGWSVRQGAEDVTFRDTQTSVFSIGSARRISILGGEIGPWTATNSGDPKIAKSAPTSLPPTEILVDGVRFRDIVRPPGSGLHIECLQIGSANGVVVRNSTFERCAVHGVFVQSYGSGYTLANVRIENNVFGVLEGYHAIKVSVPGWAEPCVGCVLVGNRASKPVAVNVERTGSSIRVAGNTMSSADLYGPGWCDHGLGGVLWDANTFLRAPFCGTNVRLAG
jgi:hypothetical protein